MNLGESAAGGEKKIPASLPSASGHSDEREIKQIMKITYCEAMVHTLNGWAQAGYVRILGEPCYDPIPMPRGTRPKPQGQKTDTWLPQAGGRQHRDTRELLDPRNVPWLCWVLWQLYIRTILKFWSYTLERVALCYMEIITTLFFHSLSPSLVQPFCYFRDGGY